MEAFMDYCREADAKTFDHGFDVQDSDGFRSAALAAMYMLLAS